MGGDEGVDGAGIEAGFGSLWSDRGDVEVELAAGASWPDDRDWDIVKEMESIHRKEKEVMLQPNAVVVSVE